MGVTFYRLRLTGTTQPGIFATTRMLGSPPESADTDYDIFSNTTLLMLVSGARDSKECTKPVIIRPICVVLHPTPDVISCAISTLISSCVHPHGQQNAVDSKCAQWQAPEIQFLCATSAVSASCSTCPVTQREGVYAVPN